MDLERMTGMTEQLDLAESNQIALSLRFRESRNCRKEKEGTDNV